MSTHVCLKSTTQKLAFHILFFFVFVFVRENDFKAERLLSSKYGDFPPTSEPAPQGGTRAQMAREGRQKVVPSLWCFTLCLAKSLVLQATPLDR